MYTIHNKFRFISLLIIGLFILYNLSISWFEPKYNNWNDNTIIIGYLHERREPIFILPKDKKLFILDDLDSLVKPYSIKSSYDIRIDKSKVIICFIDKSFIKDRLHYREEYPCNIIVVSYNLNDKNDKKIIKIPSTIGYYDYLKIYISNNSYWIRNRDKIYQVDKNLNNATFPNLNFEHTSSIIVDEDDQLLYENKEDATIYCYKDGKSYPVYKCINHEHLNGWNTKNKYICIRSSNGDYKVIDYTGNIVGKMKIPTDEAYIRNLGTVENASMVKFISNNGQIPFIDFDMLINHMKEAVDYSYFYYFIYDSKAKRFFRLDKKEEEIIESGYIDVMYEGHIDLESIAKNDIAIYDY